MNQHAATYGKEKAEMTTALSLLALAVAVAQLVISILEWRRRK